MLKITVPGKELYDEENNRFLETRPQELQLEHSLVSISKWESKWKKPFLSKGNKNNNEIMDYIVCMTLTQNVDPIVYASMTQSVIDEITEYINAPMTATTFSKETKTSNSSEVVTSELIYYWMISFDIPFECQKWHLNRLLTLINVCNIKNQPAKKTSHKDLVAKNRALNAERRAKYNTKG